MCFPPRQGFAIHVTNTAPPQHKRKKCSRLGARWRTESNTRRGVETRLWAGVLSVSMNSSTSIVYGFVDCFRSTRVFKHLHVCLEALGVGVCCWLVDDSGVAVDFGIDDRWRKR